ncbi:ParB N-terminal domain-containing protein [Lentzea sp. NPDC004782]|uniref:ParB and winged helix-turn-helix domain-containing protein n=1 Tax=Lentzea sp. NPDC004782 TaxID=3154458 RepID=UPI0033B7B504
MIDTTFDGNRVTTVGAQAVQVGAVSPPASGRGRVSDSLAEMVPICSLMSADTPRLDGQRADHVKALAESGAALPPIVVHRPTMRVVDGMHRLHAALMRGQDMISVRFFDGDERDAFVFAVQANIAHGMPLTPGDRRAAAERIVTSHPGWSDRAVAAVAGLSAKRVAEIRQSMAGQAPMTTSRIGRDGRVRPINSAQGRLMASELIKRDPTASLREIAKEAGISPATVADVRDRLSRGEDPVPPKQRGTAASGGDRENCPEPEVSAQATFRPGDARSLAELAMTMESLKRDPSLRFNQAGRVLLRILDTCIVAGREKHQIVGNLPVHRVSSMVELARGCAEILQVFADDLQRRAVS